MKALFWSDLHLTPYNEFSKITTDGLTTHLHDLLATMEWVGTMAVKHEVDVVFFLGDMFESNSSLDVMSLNVCCEGLARLQGKILQCKNVPRGIRRQSLNIEEKAVTWSTKSAL